MDHLELFPSLPSRQTMTVKEVADALNVAAVTVNQNVQRLFPGLARNGIATLLDECQVTAIKQAIEKSGRNDLMNVHKVGESTTDLEIAQMTLKVIMHHKDKADRLEAELAAVAPKIALADAIGRSDRQMSITDASKHFGLHPIKEVFPYLRDAGYLTARDLPTQAAIDAGYLALKEAMSQDGRMFQQAVVETWQLENWRAHVVHQIKRWNQAIKPLKAR